MKVTEKEVAYVADLAHLELTAAEKERMLRDLNSILDYIGMLAELDTRDVPPMAQVLAAAGGSASGDALSYARREDALRPSLSHEDALHNSPERDRDFFKVPKVIER